MHKNQRFKCDVTIGEHCIKVIKVGDWVGGKRDLWKWGSQRQRVRIGIACGCYSHQAMTPGRVVERETGYKGLKYAKK